MRDTPLKFIIEIDDEWHPMIVEMPSTTTDVEFMKADTKHSIVKGAIVVEPSGYYVYEKLANNWGSLSDYTHWRFLKGGER